MDGRVAVGHDRTRAVGHGGMRMEFFARLRLIEHELEQLRTSITTLHQHLSARLVPDGAGAAPPQDEYLCAYV